jgi:hypothetical protein
MTHETFHSNHERKEEAGLVMSLQWICDVSRSDREAGHKCQRYGRGSLS